MARSLLTLAVIVVIALILNQMYRSWQRRKSRTMELPALPSAPAGESRSISVDHATYLGTVTDEHWLDRVASHGLGGRGPCSAAVTASGIVITRVGQAGSVFIAGSSIAEVVLARGIAGRTYGRDSVVVVSWKLGGELLHTGLRVADEDIRRSFVDRASAIATHATTTVTAQGRSQ